MHLAGFPKPYYASFLLRDINWFNTWAGSGSVYRKRSDHTRNVLCDIRVGSYKYDQVMQGGLNDNDDELESYQHVSMPIDDKDYGGLRIALWRLTDAKYREAIADYAARKSQSISTVDVNKKFHSFKKLPPVKSIKYVKREHVDEDKWTDFCRRASDWLADLPGLTSAWVEFDITQTTKIFVSTENRTIVQQFQVCSLIATIRKLTKSGANLEQELVMNVGSQSELPSMHQFRKLMKEKYNQLQKSSKAKKINSFSGPVLLYPIPAGVLIHEAVGHRLEGSRLLSSYEGQTFKDKYGDSIVKIPLTVKDNPRLKKFNNQSCIGSFDFDDEGAQASDALLVKDGKLVDFLSTRAQNKKKKFEPNGHARSQKHARAISRMGVTIIDSNSEHSIEELRAMLLDEIKKQDKPCGMIIYETAGGETATTSYDFQAFAGEIAFATLLYPNGKEVPIRGVNFVGTPLQALNNVIAASDEQELFNSYCGAESGFIPISTIAPALLLRNLELQNKSEELVTQYILPKPKI